uniref:Uncharacterized protein n=1 Tax=Anguilla anguilla TaxID=7936 RepID=A0A0E9X1M1_ANGAN
MQTAAIVSTLLTLDSSSSFRTLSITVAIKAGSTSAKNIMSDNLVSYNNRYHSKM